MLNIELKFNLLVIVLVLGKVTQNSSIQKSKKFSL